MTTRTTGIRPGVGVVNGFKDPDLVLSEGVNCREKRLGCMPSLYAAQGDELHLHRPLTLFRRVRGLACLACLLYTSFVLLLFLAPFVYFVLRSFSVHYCRLWTAFFTEIWLSVWPYLFEKVNETKVIFAGDVVPREDRVLLMCNHRTEVDWMYTWNFAIRRGKLGYCKKWEADEQNIQSYLSSFQDKRDPLWLVIFPEGTDFSEAKRDKANEYAKRELGYPALVNVLQPRTRGCVTCLSQLRGSLDAVYDLTVGYKARCPLFINNLYGTDPSEVHMHIRRIPISEIPESEESMTKWLFDLFQSKDQILASFSETGSFPNSGIGEKPLNVAKGVFNFLLLVISSSLIWWWLYKSMWMKVYMCAVSVALTVCTYFSWRPMPLYSRFRSKRKKL